MDDISNRTLAIFLVTAIVVSLGATVHVLNQMAPGATGRATTDAGNVSLTVSSTVSIILNNDVIDFGSGYVNTTKATCQNNATLRAEGVYVDVGDCWTASETPESLLLENDGNRNVTVTIVGENETSFFNSYAGAFEYNISWKARDNETGSCNEFGAGATAYRPLESYAQIACDNLDYFVTGEVGGDDEIAIDVEVKIPADLEPGTYENSTITFTASVST